jgi:hypothetical protein
LSGKCLYCKGTKYAGANIVLRENAAFGVQFYTELLDGVFTHVTAYKNGRGGIHSGGSSDRNRVFNSIALENITHSGFENISDGSYHASHCIAFDNGGQEWGDVTRVAECIEVDPRLDANLVPQAGSPAIGHVDPAWVPPFDILGSPRRGAQSCAGAYEVAA